MSNRGSVKRSETKCAEKTSKKEVFFLIVIVKTIK